MRLFDTVKRVERRGLGGACGLAYGPTLRIFRLPIQGHLHHHHHMCLPARGLASEELNCQESIATAGLQDLLNEEPLLTCQALLNQTHFEGKGESLPLGSAHVSSQPLKGCERTT